MLADGRYPEHDESQNFGDQHLGAEERQVSTLVNHTRLEWNAIIEHLIESSGENAEARTAIAALGATLRPMNGIRMDAAISHRADRISGATPEHGNIEIDPDSREKKSVELGFGTVERVGYYKISRSRRNRFLFLPREDLIVICHHWKSDLATGSDTELPEAWCLNCDLQMKPVWFGQFVYTTMGLGGLSVTFSEIKELWGPKPGARHYGDMRLMLRTN